MGCGCEKKCENKCKRGKRGCRGHTGATGARGFTGPQGVAGPTGANGLDGVTGPTGANGLDGVTGPTGANGTSGVVGAAEFVQYTQSPNNSVASGLAFELLTDNPLGVYNTAGITTGAAPTQGTEFFLPIGVYIVDFETSMSSIGPIAISTSLFTGGPYTVDINSKAGSTTATTWVHGRSIINATSATFAIIGPTDSVVAAVAPTGGSPEYIVRVTFLKIA